MDISKVEIITVIASLSAVIIALWTIVRGSIKRDQVNLEDCQQKYEKVNGEVIELHARFNHLQGEMTGVKTFSKAVLERIDSLPEAYDRSKLQ